MVPWERLDGPTPANRVARVGDVVVVAPKPSRNIAEEIGWVAVVLAIHDDWFLAQYFETLEHLRRAERHVWGIQKCVLAILSLVRKLTNRRCRYKAGMSRLPAEELARKTLYATKEREKLPKAVIIGTSPAILKRFSI